MLKVYFEERIKPAKKKGVEGKSKFRVAAGMEKKGTLGDFFQMMWTFSNGEGL